MPSGHSSSEKIIGQFSTAIVTPRSSACATSRGQTLRKSRMLSGTLLSLSLPTNVPTIGTPSLSAATTTRLRWSFAASARADPGGGCWGSRRARRSRARAGRARRGRSVRRAARRRCDRPRVSPALAARRGPARDLQHLEPVSGGPGRDLLQRESREGGGQESQLHGSTSVSTSTHRRSASDRATASPRTFPACPSSKVG